MRTCSFYFVGGTYAHVHSPIYTHAVGTRLSVFRFFWHQTSKSIGFTCTQVAVILVPLQSMSKNVLVCKVGKKKTIFNVDADVKRSGQTKKKSNWIFYSLKSSCMKLRMAVANPLNDLNPFSIFFFSALMCAMCVQMDNTRSDRNIKEIVRLYSSIVVHTRSSLITFRI